jgi:hypothetical protein
MLCCSVSISVFLLCVLILATALLSPAYKQPRFCINALHVMQERSSIVVLCLSREWMPRVTMRWRSGGLPRVLSLLLVGARVALIVPYPLSWLLHAPRPTRR